MCGDSLYNPTLPTYSDHDTALRPRSFPLVRAGRRWGTWKCTEKRIEVGDSGIWEDGGIGTEIGESGSGMVEGGGWTMSSPFYSVPAPGYNGIAAPFFLAVLCIVGTNDDI